MVIKTNYISATAGSSSFPSCPAFTYSAPIRPSSARLPPSLSSAHHRTALFFLFFFIFGVPIHQCAPKSISTWGCGRRCAHTGFTRVPHVSVPITTEPVLVVLTGPKWRHSVSLILFGWGLLYFLTSVLLLVSIHLKWAIQTKFHPPCCRLSGCSFVGFKST